MLTVANQITMARLALIPLLITLVLSNQHGWAFVVFLVAGISDALDGLIARAWDQSSRLGAFLDPMADKLLMTACFIVLSLPDHPRSVPEFQLTNHIPLFVTVVTVSRDVFIVLVALMIHLAVGFTRFAPTLLGKLTTGTQLITIGTVLMLNYRHQEATIVVLALCWLTLAVTLASGLHYIYHVAFIAGRPSRGRDKGRQA
jgi:cardiolipin synthase